MTFTSNQIGASAEQDEAFMALALDCARQGRGWVEPNPVVGAVLVREGKEIARGWHRRFGWPHAEVEALTAARAAGQNARGATLYVTLEPCCHHGKTPPCTDAVILAGIARVVAAMQDPDEQVSGKGFERLRRAGIEVAVGVGSGRARELLAAYRKLRVRRLPWVICKWAQTPGGLLALPPGQGRWISNEQSRAHVHDVRGLCDGIVVGVGTVLADDPLLTNRGRGPRRPARIVLDSHLRTPPACRLVQTAHEAPVIVATTQAAVDADADPAARLRQAGVEVLVLPPINRDSHHLFHPENGDCPYLSGGVDLGALLAEMGKRRWTYLIVEGGATVLGAFLSAGLADELMVYCPASAPLDADPAGKPDSEGLPRFDLAEVAERLSLGPPEITRFDDDVLLRYVLTG